MELLAGWLKILEGPRGVRLALAGWLKCDPLGRLRFPFDLPSQLVRDPPNCKPVLILLYSAFLPIVLASVLPGSFVQGP